MWPGTGKKTGWCQLLAWLKLLWNGTGSEVNCSRAMGRHQISLSWCGEAAKLRISSKKMVPPTHCWNQQNLHPDRACAFLMALPAPSRGHKAFYLWEKRKIQTHDPTFRNVLLLFIKVIHGDNSSWLRFVTFLSLRQFVLTGFFGATPDYKHISETWPGSCTL